MNQEFKNLFKKKAPSVFDDVEYFVDLRGGSDGEYIVYYNGMIFSVQHFVWNNVLNVSAALTGVTYKGKTLQPPPIDWEYSENSTNYSTETLVDNLICEITSCNVKGTLRKVMNIIDSIKEDLTEDEFQLLKYFLDIYD